MKKRFLILFWVIVVSFLCAIFLIHVMNLRVSSTIRSYSEIEAKRFGNYMINYSVDSKFLEQLDEDIFEITKNDSGEIQLIDFKAKEANLLLEEITQRVQKKLIDLENGDIHDIDLANTFYGLQFKKIRRGVVCEIPSGVLFSNFFLSNNGPVIPIKLNFIGQVVTNLKTKVKSYGINSVYLESSLQIVVNERVTMPLRTNEVIVKVDIPLSIKIIQGTIPNYYLNSLEKESASYSLPLTEK